MRGVTLLVCLNPTIKPELINELSFYRVISPITPVSNVKMVSKEGQLKAFIQVTDDHSAATVISAIHGKVVSFGKIKVFVSHKKFVNYEKPLAEILGLGAQNNIGDKSLEKDDRMLKAHNSTCSSYGINNNNKSREDGTHGPVVDNDMGRVTGKDLNRDLEYLDDSNYQDYINEFNQNQFKKRIRNEKSLNQIINNNTAINVVPKRRIDITNDNPLELKSVKIAEIFGRFGNIVKKSFDSSRNVWTIIYDTKEAAEKAKGMHTNLHIQGYKLVDPTTPDDAHYKAGSGYDKPQTNPKTLFTTNLDPSFLNVRESVCSSTLKIIDNAQKTSIAAMCRLIAYKRLPVQLLEAFDLKKQISFFIVQFNNKEEAMEVYRFINAHTLSMPQIESTFVCVSADK